MTLSNFDWTDKNTAKWYIMLPTGHEGPYSLDHFAKSLAKNKIAGDVKIWAEGLNDPLPLKDVLYRSHSPSIDDDLPPPLPDLPEFDSDGPPPLPPELNFREERPVPKAQMVQSVAPEEEAPVEVVKQKNKNKNKNKKSFALPRAIWLLLLLIPLSLFLISQWIKDQEKFSIRRHPHMSMEVHARIMKSFPFEGWDKEIFFREFVPADLTTIWLVTSSFETCQVEAEFNSMPGKVLAIGEPQINFKSRGILKDHVTELTKFEFSQGTKILPGLYQMSVKASDCQWDGLAPKLANHFKAPPPVYQAKTKVVLFEKGAEEFNQLLNLLNQKKAEANKKQQGKRDLFWDDLQQKLQTLQAITLQVEQLMTDYFENKKVPGPVKFKAMVDQYAKKYGNFLTNFVVANEKYFADLAKGELRPLLLKNNYEDLIRLTSKKVGLTSMQIIEDLQKLRKPSQAQLDVVKTKMQKNFAALKEEINAKLIEVTEDRSATP